MWQAWIAKDCAHAHHRSKAYFFSSWSSAKTQRMKNTAMAMIAMVTTIPVGVLIFSTKSRMAPIS